MPNPQVGQTVVIGSRLFDPITGLGISTATCQINFYAPGKNPQVNPGDRTVDHGPFTANYDSNYNGYVAYVPTTGWAAGVWTYQAYFVSTFTDWQYATVEIDA